MADDWLPEAERISCTKTGGSYDGTPYCFVVHTTEGDPGSVDGCRAMAESHTSPPQLWAHPGLRWFAQGIPLSRSAYALAHSSGDPQTNKAGAIQVEVFGFAKDTPSWPGEWLDWLGATVLGSVLRAGWPIDTTQVCPTTGSDGYGQGGSVRLDWDTWATYPGVCCHSNVPGNDHWDAGAIDLNRIVRAAGGAGPAPPPPEEDDLPYFLFCKDKAGGQWWLTDMLTNTRACDTLADALNVDWLLRNVGGKPGVVCNRGADGLVAGPIGVEDSWLDTITGHRATTQAEH
jgi:hypothetical protein